MLTREVVADLDAGVAIYWDFENVHACVLDELRGEGRTCCSSSSSSRRSSSRRILRM